MIFDFNMVILVMNINILSNSVLGNHEHKNAWPKTFARHCTSNDGCMSRSSNIKCMNTLFLFACQIHTNCLAFHNKIRKINTYKYVMNAFYYSFMRVFSFLKSKKTYRRKEIVDWLNLKCNFFFYSFHLFIYFHHFYTHFQ